MKASAVKKETPARGVTTSGLPGISTSKIDVDAKPLYKPAGKPITQVNIDDGMDAEVSDLSQLTFARFE